MDQKEKLTTKKVIKAAIERNQKLKKFLMDHHVYSKYINATVNRCTDPSIRNIISIDSMKERIVYGRDISTIINNTLSWHTTNQGSHFWNKIYSIAYKEECKNNFL